MEFLARTPCQCKVHPKCLTGRIILCKEGPAAKPLETKLLKALIERIAPILPEVMNVLGMVFPVQLTGEPERAGRDRAPPIACVGSMSE